MVVRNCHKFPVFRGNMKGGICCDSHLAVIPGGKLLYFQNVYGEAHQAISFSVCCFSSVDLNHVCIIVQ